MRSDDCARSRGTAASLCGAIMNALDVLEEAQDAPTNALEVLQTASLGFTSAFNGSYSIGQEVDLTWNSPYELTSLEVWQGPNGAGSYAVDTLAGRAA